MFIPLLAAAISAATFTKLGAVSVQVTVLSGALWTTLAVIVALAAYIMWQHMAVSKPPAPTAPMT